VVSQLGWVVAVASIRRGDDVVVAILQRSAELIRLISVLGVSEREGRAGQKVGVID
jgi:hypothetical protein